MTKPYTVRFDDHLMARIEEKAKARGVSKAKEIQDRIELTIDFRDEVDQWLEEYSRGIGIKKVLLLQNFLIDSLARTWAQGPFTVMTHHPHLGDVFSFASGELVTGKKLRDNLREKYVAAFTEDEERLKKGT